MTNYHAHTFHCNHAINTVDEMVEAAIKQGYRSFGISEHIYWPNDKGGTFRLTKATNDEYVKEMLHAKEKYGSHIKLRLGYESEYCKEMEPHLQAIHDLKTTDYMIFGNHRIGNLLDEQEGINNLDIKTPELLNQYYDQMVAGIASGLFVLVAHPDISIRAYRKFDEHLVKNIDKLIAAAIKYDMPLGFNANGYLIYKDKYSYPCRFFWEQIAKHKNIKVVIEMDAHSTSVLSKNYHEEVKALAIEWGLADNLVENIFD